MTKLNYRQIIGIIIIVFSALMYVNLGALSGIIRQLMTLVMIICGLILIFK